MFNISGEHNSQVVVMAFSPFACDLSGKRVHNEVPQSFALKLAGGSILKEVLFTEVIWAVRRKHG